MSEEKTQPQRNSIEDLPEPEKELTIEEAAQGKGGLPAVQKVREAAARLHTNTGATDD